MRTFRAIAFLDLAQQHNSGRSKCANLFIFGFSIVGVMAENMFISEEAKLINMSQFLRCIGEIDKDSMGEFRKRALKTPSFVGEMR